jgi:hypothetical protein
MDKKEPKAFEKYPLSTVLITNGIGLLVCITSVYLVWQLGTGWGILFIVYLLDLEFSAYKHSCSSCYYYGKRCGFGRGKIALFLVRKDDPKKFCQKEITWKDLSPLILGNLIPVLAGIVLLIKDFNWLILVLTIILIANWFFINPLIYNKLVCLHCKQRRLCCPANNFFSKKKKQRA